MRLVPLPKHKDEIAIYKNRLQNKADECIAKAKKFTRSRRDEKLILLSIIDAPKENILNQKTGVDVLELYIMPVLIKLYAC
ncbi:hypothetical protein [Legionella clemsonensis]|uniref:Uncharacterized protein n=1 Tax=Legionella clemsonensis TaxID=1867846 RepID=A0A222P198_9GAMM|nr:hypothetical protein [Legionella clemsonensis]ASQ45607.1 hypothetical protein clem_05255 [Legionella clemsonensis]